MNLLEEKERARERKLRIQGLITENAEDEYKDKIQKSKNTTRKTSFKENPALKNSVR